MAKIQNDVTSNHVMHRLLPTKKSSLWNYFTLYMFSKFICCVLIQTEACVRQIWLTLFKGSCCVKFNQGQWLLWSNKDYWVVSALSLVSLYDGASVILGSFENLLPISTIFITFHNSVKALPLVWLCRPFHFYISYCSSCFQML